MLSSRARFLATAHLPILCVLVSYCLASQEVVHVVTAEDLQQALLEPTVVHVVLTQHLSLKASNTTLPFLVHGVKKTIRVRYNAWHSANITPTVRLKLKASLPAARMPSLAS